jgi:hypothetical protein
VRGRRHEAGAEREARERDDERTDHGPADDRHRRAVTLSMLAASFSVLYARRTRPARR